MIFDFAEVYKPIFKTKARYLHLWGGRGRGGSFTATQLALQLITSTNYFRGYFMREVFNDIRDSLWRDFKDRIEENEYLNESDFAFNDSQMTVTYLPTGNMIMSKGFKKSSGNRTAKLKSLAGATHVFIEEAEENDEDNFRQLDDSLRTKKGQTMIVMVFNPPNKNHWIIKRWYHLTESKIDGYFTATAKADPALLSIFSDYLANYENLNESFRYNYDVKYKEEHENKTATDESYYPTMVKGLISEGLKGRIFKGWERIDKMPGILPKKYGLDFGFNHPCVLVEIEKDIKKKVCYAQQLVHATGLTNEALEKRMISLGIRKSDQIIADSEEPKSIDWFFSRGWNMVKVDKPKITERIKQAKEYKMLLTEDSTEFWTEYENYAWALDRNKNPTDQPIDKFNHCMDAWMYILFTDDSGESTAKSYGKGKIRSKTDLYKKFL